MAPLPKRRHSSRRQAKRTRALKTARVTLVRCQQCNAMRISHRVCDSCGYYAGKPIIIKKEKSKK